MKHGVGQHFLLDVVHAFEEDGHQQRADLIIGDRAARHAVDEETDLLARKLSAITFFSDYVLRSQMSPLNYVTQTVSLRGYRSSQLVGNAS